MSTCGCPEQPLDAATAGCCPRSGSSGRPINRHTIKALLTEAALGRVTRNDYWFCADYACDVVYFDRHGSSFTTADLRVRVWHKLAFGDRPICYCFGESEASIRAEMTMEGRSLAIERIRAHVAAGRCACDVRNPRGVCCLGDVAAAIERVQAEADGS